MTAETLALRRRKVKNESLKGWLERQHRIDVYQYRLLNPEWNYKPSTPKQISMDIETNLHIDDGPESDSRYIDGAKRYFLKFKNYDEILAYELAEFEMGASFYNLRLLHRANMFERIKK